MPIQDESVMESKMRRQNTFAEVLTNLDDQVTVRQLLEVYVPQNAKQNIVNSFNAHVERYNARISDK